MNIVILTNCGSLYGKKICNSFINNEIPIAAVVVVRQSFNYYFKLFSYVRRRIGLMDGLYFSLKRISDKLREDRPTVYNNKPFKQHYRDLGIPFYFSKGTNSSETVTILRRLSPDLLILGQTGIVNKQVLSIPKLGTLNGHPGMLPQYRGIDCAKWAIYQNDFNNIGCSVHWVDEQVDTGNIIMKKSYLFSQSESIENLVHNLYDHCTLLLTEVVLLLLSDKNLTAEPQRPEDGRQYHKMPRKLEKEVARKLYQFSK